MRHEAEHPERVERWIRQARDGLSSQQLLELFEQAMSALWERIKWPRRSIDAMPD
jgi:hypothetical protein